MLVPKYTLALAMGMHAVDVYVNSVDAATLDANGKIPAPTVVLDDETAAATGERPASRAADSDVENSDSSAIDARVRKQTTAPPQAVAPRFVNQFTRRSLPVRKREKQLQRIC